MEKPAVDVAFDPDQKFWYRVGSVAAILLALGYIVIFPLYARVGAPPSDGEAWFKYLPGRTTVERIDLVSEKGQALTSETTETAI